MSFDFDPHFTSWGPFIQHETFQIQPLSQAAFIAATTIFVITGFVACSTAYAAFKQTKRSRGPWSSGYIWMIWMEWASCVALAIICMLHLLRVIRPSFYFYGACLALWVIQTQCLLQIIINRIRIILQDRRKGKHLMIATIIAMSVINISVWCIWIPARLQISPRWIQINEVWDRIEKVLYLIIDAYLNVFFIRTVKDNLIRNGLQKYNKLVRFNQGMIVVSLLMDIVIIAAMSIPNGFVYSLFHPLAYLVKLNIELSMARLIKKIALGSNNAHNATVFPSFNSSTDKASRGTRLSEWASKQGFSIKGAFHGDKHISEIPGGVIKRTEEFTVSSVPKTDIELRSQVYASNKNVHVSVNRLDGTNSPTVEDFELTKDVKDGKGTRVQEFGSDEEALIKPQPALLPSRQSEDSSATRSMASTSR